MSRSRRALLAACAACLGCNNPAPEPASQPNVVLISLDTTRADRLSAYGYERQTTPHLDRLAARGELYTRAIATASWTLPSHASLFTGKLTASHGARYDLGGPLHLGQAIDGPWSGYRARGLAEAEVTLAERLRDGGYQTGAIVAGPWMKRIFGLAQGFDFYDDDHIDDTDGRRAESVTDSALRWLTRRDERPFFLFLNYYDPHGPYRPPAPHDRQFWGGEIGDDEPRGDLLQALYDAELHYMDSHIGRLLERLESDAEPDLIVVVGDHGELLGEHELIGHGEHLFQEELHVPLIVARPAGAGTIVDEHVQPTDLLPLILSEIGLEAPRENARSPARPVVAELYPLPHEAGSSAKRALLAGPWKLLWNSQGEHALFNLDDDPRESHNLIEAEANRAGQMAAALDGYISSLPEPGSAGTLRQLDEETRRALESLGYIK